MPAKDKDQLNAGYRDLEQRRYDAAFSAAEAFLRDHPAGPGSAEAMYLQGRVYEARAAVARRADESRAQLVLAANAYLHALQVTSIPPTVQGLAHAGLANAAFHLDDFATAVREWGLADPLVSDPRAKGWVLYRIGVCQQRLGWFTMADRTYARVRQEFPGQEVAERAAPLIGQRAFYLQIGVFASQKNAEREIAHLRKANVPAVLATESGTGRRIVRAGPFPTYADARAAQARTESQFPGSVIIP